MSSQKKQDMQGAVIGRYERNEVKPSIEVTSRIAHTLGAFLDYLVGDLDMLLEADVIKRTPHIQNFRDKDRGQLYHMIDNTLQILKQKKAFTA